MTSKEYLRAHFTKMVKWFYEEYFQQNTKEYPPTLPNGEPIDLFDLYMKVEGLGGRRVVAKENKWLEVDKELGLVENGPNLRIIYDGYLELLDWMYSIEKEKESRINETPNEEEKDKGDDPSVKKESEEVKISPKNCDEATTSSIQDEEKQHEDGQIPDSELYFQEMLDASFDDDFELELLEYAERNKDDVVKDEDKTLSVHNSIDLHVEDDEKVKCIIPSNELLQLQNLESIDVTYCKLVEEVFEVEGTNEETNSESQICVEIPNLRQMKLGGLESLKYIWKSNQRKVLKFPNLTTLSIYYCKSIRHVFTSSMVGGLLQLQDLQVMFCNNMEVIVKTEEEDEVKEEMELFPCLKSLQLVDLESLKGFCSGKVNFSWPLLHTLDVPACPEITDMLLLQH
ncbi:hypothetical protein R6Q59_006858 [Mikania micrantha]